MSSKKTNEIIRVAIIAAGVRGSHLAQQLAYCMQPAQVVAVAEPDDKRRRIFAQAHDLPNGAQFTSWEDLCNSDLQRCKRGQELIIDTINTAFGTPFKKHYVQIKQNLGKKLAHPNGV